MARNPNAKRMGQGAATGALSGATAGYMATGNPFVAAAGGLGGGIVGALLSRPGDDEKALRARMRKLERGVLGDEEAAIMSRFVDPTIAAAAEEQVRSRAIASPGATTGAQARQQILRQQAARGDIREASAEGALAVADLGERRMNAALDIRRRLAGEESRRDAQFRSGLFEGALDVASMLGTNRAIRDLGAEQERRLLAEGAAAARAAGRIAAPANAVDIDSLELGGGIVPSRDDLEAGMAATRAALDAQAMRDPVTAENVDSFLMDPRVPVAPGTDRAPIGTLGAGLGLRDMSSIGSGAAVERSEDVQLSLRGERDNARISDMFKFAGDDSLFTLLQDDGTLDDVLNMSDNEYNDYMAEYMTLGGGLVQKMGD